MRINIPPLHRAVSVVICDKANKKMLLQKRSASKSTWPGFWSNTTCTHPLPGESYQKAAERRLFEEMGIKTPIREVFRFVYKAGYDKTWGEHEYDVVFKVECNGYVKPNPSEADGYKWLDICKLKKDVKENKNFYYPWFK
jgi:isopentenyl-diphosphate delta-isomerase